MEGLTAVQRQIDSGNANLIVSTIVRVEVLDASLPDDVKSDWKNFLGRTNIQEVAVDHHISQLAHNIRDYYRQKNSDGKTVSTPDALHLATAIHYKADIFHTFDDGGKGGLGLLELSGDVAGHELTIERPLADQLDAFGGK